MNCLVLLFVRWRSDSGNLSSDEIDSFLLQEDAIIKIQAFFRSNLARQDYKALSKLCVGTCCRIACQVLHFSGWHIVSCVCVAHQ